MAKNITKSPNDARAPGLAEFAKWLRHMVGASLSPKKITFQRPKKKLKMMIQFWLQLEKNWVDTEDQTRLLIEKAGEPSGTR